MYVIIAHVHTPTGLRLERLTCSWDTENEPDGYAMALGRLMYEVRNNYAPGSVVQQVQITWVDKERE